MAGRITPEFKDQLLSRIDVVDVVSSRVQLKKAGSLFKSCCPFHSEKTPSFVVTPARQTYHCFGCGAHGNAIDFLIEHDRLSFPEAVEELALQAGLELPTDDGAAERGPDPEPLLALLEQAARLYRQQLREHPRAQSVIQYLKDRGLNGEIVREYGIGYAPAGWDFLLTRLGQDEAGRARLVSAGLVVERDGKRYDRFRDRVIFPIRDRRGRVVGLGGRVMGDEEPKYLNSPETPVFSKGRELYGLYELQQRLRRPERVLVVEGYMDVIALAQFEIHYAVATLGTATTAEHLRRLQRVAPELVFCFDGDRAGREAAWKALQTALPLTNGQQPIRFLFLPEGEDPDSLVRREGPAAFEARFSNARLLSDFLFDHLSAELDLQSTEGRARLDAEARALLQSMPAGTYRDLLQQRLSKLVGVLAGAGQTASPGSLRRAGVHVQQASARVQPLRMTKLRQAIALLLDQPDLAQEAARLPRDWEDEDNPGVPLLRLLLDTVGAEPEMSSAALCERWRETEHESVIRRLSDSRLIAHIPEEGRKQVFLDALRGLNAEAERARRARKIAEAIRASEDGLH